MEGDFPEFEALKEKLDREYKENPDVMLNEKGKVERSREFTYTQPKQEWQNPKFQEWKRQEREKVQAKAKHIVSYPATYRDARGEDTVTVYLRGDKVCLELNEEFSFAGDDFCSLVGPHGYKRIVVDTYMLYQLSDDGFLTQFSVTFDLPLNIERKNEPSVVNLTVNIQVDHRSPTPQLVQVALDLGVLRVYESQVCDTIDLALASLITKLPKSVVIKSCWSCAWSFYNPYARSHFGGLACFVGNEAIRNKANASRIFELWKDMNRDVTENHLCPSWSKRAVKHKMPSADEMEREKTFTYDFE